MANRRNDRGCGAGLTARLEADLRQKRLPDIAALTALLAPSRVSLPGVEVQLADLSACDQLLGWACRGLVPLQVLVQAILRSKATGLFHPGAE